jgi:hypothetical protein
MECRHCYAESGPGGTHGEMTTADWLRVLDQAAELGVEMVQFIGGEPTLCPDLPRLVGHALDRGLTAEVFTNLSTELWELFSRPGSVAGHQLLLRRSRRARRGDRPPQLLAYEGEHRRGGPARYPVAG